MDNETRDKTGAELKAQRFQMLADIAAELKSDVTFPTSFDVALRLRKLLNDPDADIRQITTLIGAEPLISSKLLYIANSVAVNTTGRAIRDLNTAIARLGMKTVRSVALGVALKQIMLSKELACFNQFMPSLWEHSLKTAAGAQVIARSLTRLNPGEAMLAGLTHDLGAFYMLYRAAQYEELRVRPDTVRHLVFQWHESIGESLLHALGTDEENIAAMRNHDQPRVLSGPPKTLADVIYIANQLAGGHGGLVMPSDPEFKNYEGYPLDDTYHALEAEIQGCVEEVRQAFTA